MRYKYHETQDFWKLIIFSVMIKKQALHKLFLITYSNQEIIRIHKFIWNSKIQTGHPISARKQDLVLAKTKKINCL